MSVSDNSDLLELKKVINEHEIDTNPKTATIPEGTRYHVNCYVKKEKQGEQWFDLNQKLFKLEIEAMAQFFPKAKLGYLPSGRMFWAVDIPRGDCQQYKTWKILLVYDKNHPARQREKWTSVKAYPVKPDYDEIKQMISGWDINDQRYALSRARFCRDDEGFFYFDIGKIIVHTENKEVLTAAGIVLRVQNWIDLFEKSLIDMKYRSIFCNKERIMFDSVSYKQIILDIEHLKKHTRGDNSE